MLTLDERGTCDPDHRQLLIFTFFGFEVMRGCISQSHRASVLAARVRRSPARGLRKELARVYGANQQGAAQDYVQHDHEKNKLRLIALRAVYTSSAAIALHQYKWTRLGRAVQFD